MIRKISLLLLLLLVIVVSCMEKELLMEWIQAGGILSVVISILFISLLVFFPLIPFPSAAGITGSVFGIWGGAAISLAGSMLGTMIMFFIVRCGFGDWAQRVLKNYEKFKQYETFFERNAFLSILFVRAVPVVPSPVVNTLCGISLVRWGLFFVASTLGKIPAVLTFTLGGMYLERVSLQVSLFIQDIL